jgi:hypothetical protein
LSPFLTLRVAAGPVHRARSIAIRLQLARGLFGTRGATDTAWLRDGGRARGRSSAHVADTIRNRRRERRICFFRDGAAALRATSSSKWGSRAGGEGRSIRQTERFGKDIPRGRRDGTRTKWRSVNVIQRLASFGWGNLRRMSTEEKPAQVLIDRARAAGVLEAQNHRVGGTLNRELCQPRSGSVGRLRRSIGMWRS